MFKKYDQAISKNSSEWGTLPAKTFTHYLFK